MSSSSSYAGSGEESDHEADLGLTLVERISDAHDPSHLDRTIAQQAQTSGNIHGSAKELDRLAEAMQRIGELRVAFAKGLKQAKEVKADLDWCQRRLRSLVKAVEEQHPVEFNMAKHESL